ncbi:MAG: baseplate J/gp47 family protein [Synergistaceae bacterium]|jgi:phage-related baseplate assembly protein|nr:baseplate J/gp47 family protein [Synergistaceae bacterium]
MRNIIDLSKLPAPQLIEELDYGVIVAAMRTKLRELLPEWTGYELESDPANKVLEVAAYREMLLRQRINEAARGVMIAFATGSDLDHLAAFYPETRLPGALATFTATLTLSTALEMDVTIPEDYRIVAKNGKIEARLMQTATIPTGATTGSGLFEIIQPAGMDANGMDYPTGWDAITPLPFVVKVEQTEPAHGGSNTESDEDFRRRVRESLHQYSTAGAWGAYCYHAKGADARIKDVEAWSPERGCVTVAVLSAEGDGTADDAMLQRVEEALSGEDVRPGTDRVTVTGAEIVQYKVQAMLNMYPGVAGGPPLIDAQKRIKAKVMELHGLGKDVPRTALIAAAHVEGVKSVDLIQPEADIIVERHQAACCIDVTAGSQLANDR